jgi:hypothetical protein
MTVLADAYDTARAWTAILEYELPRESRRPDLIVLENVVVMVLELKGKAVPSQADINPRADPARATPTLPCRASCAPRATCSRTSRCRASSGRAPPALRTSIAPQFERSAQVPNPKVPLGPDPSTP